MACVFHFHIDCHFQSRKAVGPIGLVGDLLTVAENLGVKRVTVDCIEKWLHSDRSEA